MSLQSREPHNQSFHMDKGTIVCNGCGGHFLNLVLFKNHTHGEDQKSNNMPSCKSGRKSDHKTFKFHMMSEDDMMEAFHRMPELEGCWYTQGQYHCNMCRKSFLNPFILFSHKILHPEDMKKKSGGVGIQTTNQSLDRIQMEGNSLKHNVIIPHVFNERSGSCSDDSDDLMGDVTKTVVKPVQDSEDKAHGSTPIIFVHDRDDEEDKVEGLMQVSRMPVKKPKVMNTGSNLAKCEKNYYCKLNRTGKGRSTPVKSQSLLPEHIIRVDPVMNMVPILEGDRRRQTAVTKEVLENQVIKSSAGDASSVKYKLVFFRLPGLNGCKMVNGKYQCDVCPEIFENLYLLFTHKMSHDTEVNGKQYNNMNEKRKSPAFGDVFGRNFVHKGKIVNGKYYCEEFPKHCSDPFLLMNRELNHEKCMYVTETCDAQGDTTDVEEEDSMCFECNLCQAKFDTVDGLADHIEAHVADTQDGTSCTFSDSALSDVSMASTSACSTEIANDSFPVKGKQEPVTDYEGEENTMEPHHESTGFDLNVSTKQEPEPSDLPQHSTENKERTHVDVPLEDELCLKRTVFGPVVRLKRIKLVPNEVYIVKKTKI